MSEQKKWIIGVLLAVLALCYVGYQRHHQAKLDEFRQYVERAEGGKIPPYRRYKAEQLGVSKSEMAKIIQEVQAMREFDRR
jgi:Tfp pilus assembly protein PilO